MENVRYMISDAANIVNVESHVLRYWEEELELLIPRNEMGHRYYTEENIAQFQKIKEWKEQGYQLKAIRMMIHSTEPARAGSPWLCRRRSLWGEPGRGRLSPGSRIHAPEPAIPGKRQLCRRPGRGRLSPPSGRIHAPEPETPGKCQLCKQPARRRLCPSGSRSWKLYREPAGKWTSKICGPPQGRSRKLSKRAGTIYSPSSNGNRRLCE